MPILSNPYTHVKLAAMTISRHPWLVLFLIFCLPAQALAAVLVDCEQHVADSHTTDFSQSIHVSDTHHNPVVASDPDCHGTSVNRHSTESATESPSAASSSGSPGNANSCFHCSGTCQNFKPLSLIAKSQSSDIVDHNAFSRLTQDTETGIRSNPARPPCPPVLS